MKLRLALIFTLIAIGAHYYLTNHYYELHMGVSAGDSLCNISQTFSCDTTSASSYAKMMGIPIAAWGAAANGILFVLLIGWMLRWTDDLLRLSRYTYYLAGFIALVSVVMGIISSVVLGTFCLFCMTTYLCSWSVFGLLHLNLDEDERGFSDHLKALFGPAKTYAGFLVAIPAAAFMFNAGISKKYGANELEKYIRASVADWRANPAVEFGVEPSLVKGASNEEAVFVISEFADFRCSHCKTAYPSLKAFVGARKDVQLRFYNFPLDKSCNEAMTGGDGVSCLLAKTVTCAEKVASQGWALHDSIFDDHAIISTLTLPKATAKISEYLTALSIDLDQFNACLKSDETQEWMQKQAASGKNNGVKGTPSIYVNKRKLPRGQAIPVLERAYQMTK